MTTLRAPQKIAALCTLVLLSSSSLLAGCAQDDRPISEIPFYKPEQSGANSQSDTAGSTDTVMSGHYEVSPEGKLLRPKRVHELTPPELPEVAKVYDQNGADVFVQYFVDVMDYTWLSGDSTLLRSISADSCTWCLGMADEADERKKSGGWVEHVDNRITAVEHTLESPVHPGLWDTVVLINSADHNVYDGTNIKEYSGSKYRFHVQLRYDEGRWKVTGAEGTEQ